MKRRHHLCDSCQAPRLRWQRLCPSCFRALPGSLRSGVLDAWDGGDRKAWRTACAAARAFLTTSSPPTDRTRHTPPERAYALSAAILGEKE